MFSENTVFLYKINIFVLHFGEGKAYLLYTCENVDNNEQSLKQNYQNSVWHTYQYLGGKYLSIRCTELPERAHVRKTAIKLVVIRECWEIDVWDDEGLPANVHQRELCQHTIEEHLCRSMDTVRQHKTLQASKVLFVCWN